ncbi:metal-dependent hydrolase [Halorarum halobium]|uniref:metal-dependent hydrolase n=1 Tax=Halorarum halobium TaxID=3075121 RepID=UPI0028AA8CD1|nr:metal-dependent hydrolase [Halobaculum sp. XH14]
MMATTHALVGVLIGLGVLATVPEAGGPVLLAAALGGAFPDLDVLAVHRRTLHFPVGYAALAASSALSALVLPAWMAIAAATFFAAAAVHAATDVFGGGLELRPWEATSDRALYDHLRGRWRPPRRWIRYDGAPEDFMLALAVGLPSFAALDGNARLGVVALLGISAAYAAFRRPLVDGGETLVGLLPASVLRLIPETLIEDLR